MLIALFRLAALDICTVILRVSATWFFFFVLLDEIILDKIDKEYEEWNYRRLFEQKGGE